MSINKHLTKSEKSFNLYGKKPVWQSVLKVGSTAILVSFLTAFFLFAAQITIVNFMPLTVKYSFAELFLKNQTLFQPLFNSSTTVSQNLIKAVSKINNLGFFSANSVILSAVSLAMGLLYLVQTIPSVTMAGSSVFYGKALGKNDYLLAKKVWQNSFYTALVAALIGLVLLFILTPTIVPLQAAKSHITVQELNSLQTKYLEHWAKQGYVVSGYTIHQQVLYKDKNTFYLLLTKQKQFFFLSLNATSTVLHQVSLQQIQLTQKVNINTSTLATVWNHYFVIVRVDSTTWATQFLYIMSLALIMQCFGGLFMTILRTDGELVWTTLIGLFSIALTIIFNYVFIYCCQLGLIGAGIASVLGFSLQLICYSLELQFYKKANVRFKDLKQKLFNSKLMWQIFNRGGSKFVAGIGNLILTILLTAEVSNVSEKLMPATGSEYFVAVLGAVMPFVALFTSTIAGSSKNILQLFAYNFAMRNKKRLQQAFWWTFFDTLILCLIIFCLFGVCNPIKVGLLLVFHISSQSTNQMLNSALKLMLIWMCEIPCLAFMIPGMIVFLVANRVDLAYIMSGIRTLLIPVPILLAFSYSAMMMSNSAFDAPYLNQTMWFFLNGPVVYTACYCSTIFLSATAFFYDQHGFWKAFSKNLTKTIKSIKIVND